MPLLFLCDTIEQMFGQRAHHKYYNIFYIKNFKLVLDFDSHK